MIWREGFRFVLVGLAQLMIDWAVFVATSAAGLPVAGANVLGRVAGASFGYVANARFTFVARRREPLDRWTFLRFASLWCATAAVSTVAMALVEREFGLAHAWILKPVVDGALVGASFLVNRYWVYR
ncbi:MAG: GtrA family protein [Silanimonas sp.]